MLNDIYKQDFINHDFKQKKICVSIKELLTTGIFRFEMVFTIIHNNVLRYNSHVHT